MRLPLFAALIVSCGIVLASADATAQSARVSDSSASEQSPASSEKVAQTPFDWPFTPQPFTEPDSELTRILRQAAAQTPPEPAHTGFAALAFTTGADFKAFPLRRSTWVILGIGAGAAALAHPADDSVNAHLVGSPAIGRFFAPGKWIGSVYVQAGTAAGLYVLGRYIVSEAKDKPKTNKLSHLGFDLARGLIVSQALTQGIKLSVRRERPNGQCCSFPSGHASAAFATASILERHLGYRGAWPTFVIATYVATSRLHDNVHFLSDVLFGSALGVASGWTVVGRHGRDVYTLVPVPIRGGIAVALTWTP